MTPNLTFKEKKYAQELINNSKNTGYSRWPAWSASLLLALGGFLVIATIFIALENLNPVTIKYVLLPGTMAGLAIMVFGNFIYYMNAKMEKQKILAGLLSKLM